MNTKRGVIKICENHWELPIRASFLVGTVRVLCKPHTAALFFILFLCLSVQAEASVSKVSLKTLNVGVALRFENHVSDTVTSTMEGIEVAKAIFEEDHPHVKINLKPFSYQEHLESVGKAADAIIDSHISAVIGGELSEESLLLGKKLDPHKIVLVSPTSSNPEVTRNRNYVFTANLSDAQTGERTARFIVNHFNVQAIGLMHDISSPYTDYLSVRFLKAIDEINQNRQQPIQVVHEKFIEHRPNFHQQIQSFMTKKIKYIAMLTRRDALLRFSTEAASLGYYPIFIGCDGWETLQSVQKHLVKESPFGDKFVGFSPSYWNEKYASKLAKRFHKKMISSKSDVNAWTVIGFDAAWILINAMNLAKDSDSGDEIRKEMELFRSSSLLTTAQFRFGADHAPIKDLHFFKIDAKGIKWEATIE